MNTYKMTHQNLIKLMSFLIENHTSLKITRVASVQIYYEKTTTPTK